jgi:hypothetical protein
MNSYKPSTFSSLNGSNVRAAQHRITCSTWLTPIFRKEREPFGLPPTAHHRLRLPPAASHSLFAQRLPFPQQIHLYTPRFRVWFNPALAHRAPFSSSLPEATTPRVGYIENPFPSRTGTSAYYRSAPPPYRIIEARAIELSTCGSHGSVTFSRCSPHDLDTHH